MEYSRNSFFSAMLRWKTISIFGYTECNVLAISYALFNLSRVYPLTAYHELLTWLRLCIARQLEALVLRHTLLVFYCVKYYSNVIGKIHRIRNNNSLRDTFHRWKCEKGASVWPSCYWPPFVQSPLAAGKKRCGIGVAKESLRWAAFKFNASGCWYHAKCGDVQCWWKFWFVALHHSIRATLRYTGVAFTNLWFYFH